MVTLRLTLVLLTAAALAGCDERAAASPAPDAAPPEAPKSPSTTPSAAPAPSGSAAERAPLQVLKLVFTSEVKNKEPVDKLEAIKPGERAWAHLTMRNRGAEARPIAMVFKVNGEQRSKVDLKIDPSWSYRTWAYSTLRAGDVSGELVVEVRDDDGAVITTARLPIKGDGPAKPRPQKRAPDDL